MGSVFEELVRKFNEEAGEHWTPRDAVRLMANLVFLPIVTLSDGWFTASSICRLYTPSLKVFQKPDA